MNTAKPTQDQENETAQNKKKWRRLYIIVLSELVLLIALFYLFTTYFS